MRHTRERRDRRQLIAGLSLIVIGGLFLADRFYIGDIGRLIGDYWPLFIIIPGVARLFDPENRGGALFMIGLGGWFLVCNLGLFGMNWGNSWPVILVVIGVSMMFEGIFPQLRGRKRRRRHRLDDSEEKQSAIC